MFCLDSKPTLFKKSLLEWPAAPVLILWNPIHGEDDIRAKALGHRSGLLHGLAARLVVRLPRL